MTLSEYVKRTEQAIRQNPPRQNPAYADDPVGVWRYYMRCFGAGLDVYDRHEVDQVITSLYSGWFMRLEFGNPNRPAINADDFRKWIVGG